MFDSATGGGGSVIILGIDPGLANTGWGVIESTGPRFRCLGYGCVTTQPAEDVSARLRSVHDALVELIGRMRPDEAAIEKIYFGVNVRTAFATGQARGAALVATATAGLPVGEYGPSEIKNAVVGYGGADKRQIQFMVASILGLDHEPSPDHAADALAVAICHSHSRLPSALLNRGSA